MAQRWSKLAQMRIFLILCAAACALMAAESDDAKLLPGGPAKPTVARVCIDCHGSANFRRLRLNRDGWSEKVDDMVDRGAKATDAELGAIVDYLAENFGPGSKVNVNTAPMVELKVLLGLSAKQADAVVDYREVNGRFTEWRDLLKVPGVDAKVIEEKQAMMAF